MFEDISEQVSDPASPSYSPSHPSYLPTSDPSSPYFMPADDLGDRAAPADRVAHLRDSIARLGRAPDAKERAFIEAVAALFDDQGNTYNGMHLGDGADNPPRTYWHAIDHPTMMTKITTNADAGAVHQQASEWKTAASTLPELASDLERSFDTIAADWRGAGAYSAASRFNEIGNWISEVAAEAGRVSAQQSERAAILDETQRQMAAQPPVEFDVRAANERLHQITDPVAADRQLQADRIRLQRQQEAQSRAADLMTHFDLALADTGRAPVFPPPPFTTPPPAPPTAADTAPADTGQSRHPAAKTQWSSTPASLSHEPAAAGSDVAPPTPTTAPPGPVSIPPKIVSADTFGTAPETDTTAAASWTSSPAAPAFDPGVSGLHSFPAGPPGDDLGRTRALPLTGSFIDDTGRGTAGASPGPSLPGGRQTGSLPPGSAARPGTAVVKPVGAGQEPAGGRPGSMSQPGIARRKEEEQRRGRHFKDQQTPEIFETDEKTAAPTLGLGKGRQV